MFELFAVFFLFLLASRQAVSFFCLDEKKVKYSEAEAEEESQPIMSFPLSSETRCPSEIIDIISHTILTCLLAFFPPKRVSDARNKSFCSVCAPSKKKKNERKKIQPATSGRVCVCRWKRFLLSTVPCDEPI